MASATWRQRWEFHWKAMGAALLTTVAATASHTTKPDCISAPTFANFVGLSSCINALPGDTCMAACASGFIKTGEIRCVQGQWMLSGTGCMPIAVGGGVIRTQLARASQFMQQCVSQFVNINRQMTFRFLPLPTLDAATAYPLHSPARPPNAKDNIVICWGSNTDFTGMNVVGEATPPANLSHAVDISCGSEHACAVLQDGTVRCWGNNRDPTSGIPVHQTTPPRNLRDVTAISSGKYHSCAMLKDGTLSCWGSNYKVKEYIGQATPPPNLQHAVDISCGAFYSCALIQDGNISCWGAPGKATPPANLEHVTSISCGDYHCCALLPDGKVKCWGSNDLGQAIPPANLGNVISISSGSKHCCAVLLNGKVSCWGNNDDHTGNYVGQATPPANLGHVTYISCGWDHCCAVLLDSTVKCWGANEQNKSSPPALLGNVPLLSVGAHHACAIGHLMPPPEPTLDWKRLLLFIGGAGIVAVVSVLGLYCWCSRNPCKRQRVEQTRLREIIVQMEEVHNQQLLAMTSLGKSNKTEVLILASSPEFGTKGEPILPYARAMVEVTGGICIAGDARDKFHRLVMDSREMQMAMQGWRTAWKGKCDSSFKFHKKYHPEATQRVLSVKGGPECDWEQAYLAGGMRNMYAMHGISMDTPAPFHDLNELKVFLMGRNLESNTQQIIEELWVDYVNFCRIAPQLSKAECQMQSEQRIGPIVKALRHP